MGRQDRKKNPYGSDQVNIENSYCPRLCAVPGWKVIYRYVIPENRGIISNHRYGYLMVTTIHFTTQFRYYYCRLNTEGGYCLTAPVIEIGFHCQIIIV